MKSAKQAFRATSCYKLILCTLVGLLLTGCSNKGRAPISRAEKVSLEHSDNHRVSGSTKAGNDYQQPLNSRSNGWDPAPPSMVIEDEPNLIINSTRSDNSTALSSTILSRNYSVIPKGSFVGRKYTVNPGDTLFYIAWITNNDYRMLAEKNNIVEPYNLITGQVLDIDDGSLENVNSVANNGSRINNQSIIDLSNGNGETALLTESTTSPSVKDGVGNSSVTKNTAEIVWRWPAEGKLIDKFSTSVGGNKGIDIAGSRGQSIVSTAEGRVVYAGNALRGYGNLIIIKHNDDYLSAYAHNHSMLVSEQQDVKAGQKIATMGSTGANSVRLHFEVRYKGKSVNPLQYLPQQ